MAVAKPGRASYYREIGGSGGPAEAAGDEAADGAGAGSEAELAAAGADGAAGLAEPVTGSGVPLEVVAAGGAGVTGGTGSGRIAGV